jgi:hypothetical protein
VEVSLKKPLFLGTLVTIKKKHYYDDISHPDIYPKYILGCGFTNNPCESQTGLKFGNKASDQPWRAYAAKRATSNESSFAFILTIKIDSNHDEQ